jgi:hypothetical protein
MSPTIAGGVKCRRLWWARYEAKITMHTDYGEHINILEYGGGNMYTIKKREDGR